MREMLRPPRRGGLRTQGGQDTQCCLLRPPGACHSVPNPLKEGTLSPDSLERQSARQERKGRGGKLGGWGAEEESRGGGGLEERKEIGSTPERQSPPGKSLPALEREFNLVISLPSRGHWTSRWS